MNKRRQFQDGEKQCSGCGDPLPAFESNSQQKYSCRKHECRQKVYAQLIQMTRVIEEGEVVCSLAGCTRPGKAGTFQTRRKLFFCCSSHQKKHYIKTEVGICKACGKPILDFPFMKGRRTYCSSGHRLTYLSRQRVLEVAGPFAEMINAFMEGEGRTFYAKTTWKTARAYFINFFGWLKGQGVVDLDGLNPDLITAYMLKEKQRGIKTDNYIGHLNTLFAWAKIRKRMTIQTPIVLRFHKVRQSRKVFRAYSRAQVEALWRALDERGTTLMKAVVAIGLEAGCRISETGAIRLSNIDFERQTLFIEKSKNGTQRYTHFGDKTFQYLQQWLQERDLHCGHDFVFYTGSLRPVTSSGHLQTLIKTAIKLSPEFPNGFMGFSSHACRHTWATNLANGGMDPISIMALGGWKSWSSMQIYIKTSQDRVESQYQEAVQRAAEERLLPRETVVSLADLLALESGTRVSGNCR